MYSFNLYTSEADVKNMMAEISNLFFVCGALRSGSTMLHLMLDNHPRVDNPGEFDFLFDCVGDDGSLPQLDDFYHWLELNRIFNSHHLTIDKSLSPKELIRSFVEQIKKQNNVLALNVHRNFHRIPYIFPEANYIHLVRDPRDVARSSIEMGWAGNVYYGVDHWIESEKSWLKLSALISSEKIYTLHYENLVTDSESELKTLCNFIGLPYSAGMLDYSAKSTYSAPDKSLIEQWKRKLSSSDIANIEYKAKTMMLRLGYQAASDANYRPSILHRLLLKIHNILYKNQFAILRYGLVLYVQEKLGRIFNINSLHTFARLKCNQIDTLYLK